MGVGGMHYDKQAVWRELEMGEAPMESLHIG